MIQKSRKNGLPEKIRVLSVGDDIGIGSGPDNPSIRRHLEYAKRCQQYIGLCYTTPGFSPFHIEDNFHLYPTNSKNRFLFFLDAFRLGSRLIQRWSPQVIISQDAFGFGLLCFFLKKRFHLPLVIHFHADFLGNSYWLRERALNRLYSILGRFTTKRSDLVRTVSSKIRDNLVSMGFDPARIYYITPPVDPDPFLKHDHQGEEKINRKFGLVKNRTFMFIGRLAYQKDLSTLLKAMAILKKDYSDVKLLIVGEGPEKVSQEILAERLGLNENVFFVGNVSSDKLINFFGVSLSLVLSSLYEGTAKVIKEAAFADRPTITTETSGISDTIRHGETGLVVPIGDERAMASAMDLFLKSPGQARLMGKEAKEFMIMNFDYENGLDRLVGIWAQAVLQGSE